jgi:hypothetical protein
MTAFISTQLGGRVNLRRYLGIVRLAKPASQYKVVSTLNTADYHCRRYSNGVTCAITGHAFFVTSTAVSGH